MKGIGRLSIFATVVALIAFSGDARGDFSEKIAGTYVLAQKDGARILQISKDGNLRSIISSQFSAGVLELPFSDTLGSWKETGEREITARTANLNFESGTGRYAGVAGATYVIKFDEKFQTASVTCKGAIFPPGVNPFGPDAKPIAKSDFNCGRIDLHRIPIGG
jgi:hypothetical protein